MIQAPRQSLPVAPAADPEDDPYVGYSYSYPHKSAYGPLTPGVPLMPLWQAERRDALFLYLHLPFCEMRCGFCNLFARAGGDEHQIDAYLDALERQARVLAEATAGQRQIARLALGGGTPTYLNARQLDRLFNLCDRYFGAAPIHVPTSVETSPKTALRERLEILRQHGVQRVSLGVQSFVDAEAHAIGRPQTAREVHAALERLRAFPILNIDLIYGQPNQTITTWLSSLNSALRYGPEELYLYPLYVRPETGIGRREATGRLPAPALRRLYRAGRDLLLQEGYEQISMRFFQRCGTSAPAAPLYCCQTDAMLGLGCGARSYTTGLHYSSPFAVDAVGVHRILDAWVGQTEADFGQATWGCFLADDERRRRFVLQSLLATPGLDELEFERLFAVAAQAEYPVLRNWLDDGLLTRTAGFLHPTPAGLECSDWLGPRLYSSATRGRFDRFVRS